MPGGLSHVIAFWVGKRRNTDGRSAAAAPKNDMASLKIPKVARDFRFWSRRLLIIPLIFFPLISSLPGCAPTYGRHDPDQKQALRTLAGGVAGVLIAGNTGGAIIGAFVADVISVATIKYEDIQLENGEQAARRFREQQKQAEDKIDQEKKAEELKDKQKKAEEIKDPKRKAEERKEQEEKAEKRKFEDKRAKLIIEDSSVERSAVRTGDPVKAAIQYTLLAPEGTESVRITETRKLWTAHSTVELDSREIVRSQGTYRSAIHFKMPEYIPRGYCILYTTVSDGRQMKTARSVMNIL